MFFLILTLEHKVENLVFLSLFFISSLKGLLPIKSRKLGIFEQYMFYLTVQSEEVYEHTLTWKFGDRYKWLFSHAFQRVTLLQPLL